MTGWCSVASWEVASLTEWVEGEEQLLFSLEWWPCYVAEDSSSGNYLQQPLADSHREAAEVPQCLHHLVHAAVHFHLLPGKLGHSSFCVFVPAPQGKNWIPSLSQSRNNLFV